MALPSVNLPLVALAALLIAIVLSCFSKINVGLVSIVFAWVIGVYLGRQTLTDLYAGFPVQLFLTLTGVMLLFAQSQVNGTLEKLASYAVRLCKGNVGLIPVAYFFIGVLLSSFGPGSIATAALVIPVAMATAVSARISLFLMAIMVGCGANAGDFSPVSPGGVIVNALMDRIGLPGHEWRTYLYRVAAHAVVASAGYVLFGGLRLFKQRYVATEHFGTSPFRREHWITVAVISALILGVLFLRVNVGMAAIAGAVIMIALRAAQEAEAIKQMPWGVILMVTGVTMLIALMEKTGGMTLFTDLLARISTAKTVTGTMALITGLISAYSSTSGVVLPAFLPTVPGLVERLGGGNPFGIASSINIGASLVDVSPLSTIGALCIASVPNADEAGRLFYKLLAWGLSMTVVSAVGCFLVFR